MTGSIEAYLERLAVQRGCSPRTIDGYRADLAILARIAAAALPHDSRPDASEARAEPEPDWGAIDEQSIRRWVAAESRAGRAPKSIARRL